MSAPHQNLFYSEPSTVAANYPFSSAWHACQSSTWAQQDMADAAGRGAAAEVLAALLRQPGVWQSASAVAAGHCQSDEGFPLRCIHHTIQDAVFYVSAVVIETLHQHPIRCLHAHHLRSSGCWVACTL